MKWYLMEKYVKLVLNGFELYQGDVYVSEAFLKFLGMPDTVRSLISKAKKSMNNNWICWAKNNKKYIQLDSIPEKTRARFNLDFTDDYLKDLLVSHKGCQDTEVLDQIKAESYLMIQKEIANYKKYLPTFYELYTTSDERITQATNYAILRVILSFIKKYPKGLIDHFYDVLCDEKIAKHSIPVASKNYFYKYLKRIERAGLPNGLINGNRDKASNNLKLTQTMRDLIVYLKSYGNYTSCREISDNLKRLRNLEHFEGEVKAISESTIRNYLATREADNLTLLARQGYRRFEEKILGYLPLNRTKDPLTKILIDGYVIQVFSEGEFSEPIQLVLFAIMDTFSGFVVVEIGEVEDYTLIRKTFDKFLRFTKYKMPREVISDAHSSIQSKYFKAFRKYLEDNGVNWTVSTNPRRKGQLERWFGTLQQVYLNRISGYKGEGIKSKRKDAHPSEEILFIVKKREFLKDKNELIRLLLAAVDDYNRNAYFKDAASPMDLFHLRKPVHYIQLQDHHLPYFFWDKHEVSIKGSMLVVKKTFNGKPKKWFYRKGEYDFAVLNDSKVDAYHSPDDDKLIYIFEKNSITFIGTAEIQLRANESIMDQTAHDRKIIADFGISKAKLHKAFIDRIDEIETSLKSKFDIDPEQLRLRADFKKAEDDYVGYQLGLVSKTPEPDLSKPYKTRKGRRAVKRNTKVKKKIQKNTIRDTLG